MKLSNEFTMKNIFRLRFEPRTSGVGDDFSANCPTDIAQLGVGGAVDEWSQGLLLRDKINEKQELPGLTPGQGHLKKNWPANL